MTHDEILVGLYENTLIGNAPEVRDLTNAGLEENLEPEKMLYDALIPSLEEVGARFERGDFFVPEMLIAARAMQGALDILRPLLAETGVQQVGTYVMGTVKGDVHDIGKNLVNIMLEGAGFTVHDLGVNVAPEKFIEAIQEHKPDIVGFSAFLTTTMPMFKANINALEKAGMRDDVIVMVGGAPVTQQYADAVGADGFAADASSAVRLAKDLIAEAARRGSGVVDTVVRSRVADRRHRSDAAVLRDRRTDQPDRAQGVPGAAAGGRPLAARDRRRAAGRRRRRHARRQRRRPARGRDRADGEGDPARPGALRPADLHRLVRDRGARGRARRVRRQGARQLRHRRGRTARRDPAARRAPRRGGDRARERRRDPDGAAAPARDREEDRLRRRRPRDPARGRDHRPARDARRRRAARGDAVHRDAAPAARRARREHDLRRRRTRRSGCRAGTRSAPRSSPSRRATG